MMEDIRIPVESFPKGPTLYFRFAPTSAPFYQNGNMLAREDKCNTLWIWNFAAPPKRHTGYYLS
jgi:hypothetical protein